MTAIRITRVAAAPELGGDLACAPWRDAPWHGDFRNLDEPERKADPQSSFCMVHDGEQLYVAVRADEPQIERVRAHTGGAFWRDNQVMLSIDAEGLGRSGVELALDSQGCAVIDWREGRARFHTWDHQARHVVQIHEDGWSIQFAIPLHVLKLSSNSWRISVMRKRTFDPSPADGSPAYSSYLEWGADTGPSKRVRAEVEDLDVADFLWDAEMAVGSCTGDEATGYILRQRLCITNLAQAPRAVRIHCRLEGHDEETEFEREFDAGEKREELIEMRAGHPTALLHLTLIEAASSRPLFRHICFIDEQALSWKPHSIRQSDGQGGETCHPARFRFAPQWRGLKVTLYGLAHMDNGEIAIGGVAYSGHHEHDEQTVFAFSNDGGATWSPYHLVEGRSVRPMMLAYVGNGVLTFSSGDRFFSRDYGRTWESTPAPLASNGHPFISEGNALVDRDENGIAERIAETGQNFAEGREPVHPACAFVRWSSDGGQTWEDESQPEAWRWQESYMGKTYVRSGGEGALVRAANGWIVAALRLDMHPRYFNHPFRSDNLEGTGVSISKDDGRTWSPIQKVLEPGRMHANLVCLAGGELVMTVIRRIDMRDRKLAGYRRGCDAVISRDNGSTWDTDHMIALDDLAYCDEENWVSGIGGLPMCGHLFSIALPDDSILTTYGNYTAGGAMIHWRVAK